MTREASEIVKDLRDARFDNGPLALEAADTIERLREALDEAIEFANAYYNDLTPAGEAMLKRWEDARQALDPRP